MNPRLSEKQLQSWVIQSVSLTMHKQEYEKSLSIVIPILTINNG